MPRPWQGIIAIEGETTGDGRLLVEGALWWEGERWPLIWDREEGDHTGMTVGWVDSIWREGQFIMASGELSESEDEETQAAVSRVAELLEEGAVGVSVSLDNEDIEIRVKKEALEERDVEDERGEEDEEGRVVVVKMSRDDEIWATTSGRIRHLAIVDTPAIAEARIALVAAVGAEDFANPHFGPDGESDSRLMRQTPQREGETVAWGCPITVTDDGRIYGHAALWGRCHAGFSDRCVVVPRHGNDRSYARFLHGEAVPGVPTGPITLGTDHGKLEWNAQQAMSHYADTGRAVADVSVGEDDHGVWVSGRLRPSATEEDIAALKGSSLSGDWRGGRHGPLHLVGLLAVNSPGFLVERHSLAASITAGPCGCERSLVAVDGDWSGAVVLAVPSQEDAERLAVGEDAGELHITVAWLGDASDLEDSAFEAAVSAVGEFASEPFEVEAFAHAIFNPVSDEREPSTVLLVQSQPLADLRSAVAEFDKSEFPVWFPHLTIGYNLDESAEAMAERMGPIRITRLEVVAGEKVEVFELGDEAEGDDNDNNMMVRLAALEAAVAETYMRDARSLAASTDLQRAEGA